MQDISASASSFVMCLKRTEIVIRVSQEGVSSN